MSQATRIAVTGLHQVLLETIDVSEPGPGQAMVRLLYSAISPGTELAVYNVKPNQLMPYPVLTGYSSCAQVESVGPGVEGLAAGDIVAVRTTHVSRAVVDARTCHRMDRALDPREASLFRLLSIAVQGVRKGQVQLGQSVAVVGLGPIGFLAGQVARAAGATRVVGIDPLAWRREMAMTCGYDLTAESAESAARLARPGMEGFDLVIEATGVPSVVNQALALGSRMGRLVLLGSSRGICDGVDFYLHVHRKGLTVIGAHEGVRSSGEDLLWLATHLTDERTSLELMASGRVRAGVMVSDVMPAAKVEEAYRRLDARKEQLMTIVLDWSGM